MKNIKGLVVIVIVLIVLNCALVVMLWFTHLGKKKPLPPMHGQTNEYLTKELNLTPDQIKKYDTLRQHHMEFTRAVSEEQHLQRDSFFDNLKNPNADMATAMQLEKRILANQRKLDSATFYHFRAFRALLTPDQATKFDGLANNVMHMMAQPRGGGPRQPGPGREGLGGQPMEPIQQGQFPGMESHQHGGERPPRRQSGPDGRPMHPPGVLSPDGRPMHGPPPKEDRPPYGSPGERPPGGGPPPNEPPTGQ